MHTHEFEIATENKPSLVQQQPPQQSVIPTTDQMYRSAPKLFSTLHNARSTGMAGPAYAKHTVLQLQQQRGNHYVQRILTNANASNQSPRAVIGVPLMLQRQCACGGAASPDGKCEACRQKRLSVQRRVASQYTAMPTPPNLYNVLNTAGQSLAPDIRTNMEARFGYDFSQVRVHTDTQAAASAASAGAAAYTVGQQIVFGKDQYRPEDVEGKRLLAHELAHVIQQRAAAPVPQHKALGEVDNPLENEADRASEQVLQNTPARVTLTAPAMTPQFGLIGCMWYLWRFSRLIEDCQREFRQHCDDDILSDECQEFMDGAGFPSDAILRCVGRKNPTAMAKLLSSCSTVSLGRALGGISRGMGLRSSNEPSEGVPLGGEPTGDMREEPATGLA